MDRYMNSFDPVQYGALTHQVAALEQEVFELRSDVKELLALANKSRGGLWAGMLIASALGGALTFLADHFWRAGS
jgi:hypothetical protein